MIDYQRSKKIVTPVFVLLFIVMGGMILLPAQQEVRIRIREGMPMIPVALPEFHFIENSIRDNELKNELYDVLWKDLRYSRVFKLVPKEHYKYIQKFNPDNIIYKDWASIQANILISGKLEVSGEQRIIFSFKVYDVKSEKFILGRNFGGKKEFVRLIAHRAADEMMKHFGEKPIYTSKVVFVSDREGSDEIYIMDFDGKRQKRITFNDYIDLMPSWSSDNEKIMYTSYRRGTPELYIFHLYTGKTGLISTGGVNYSADWSPEDDRIVYTSSKNDGNTEIYLRNMKTGKEKRLTFNRVIDTSPGWSPSGKEIVFTSQRSGTPQIYTMGEEGTNVRRITYEGTYHDNAVWSPDGTRVVYVSRIEARFDVYVYNLKNNTIAKLTENAGRNENPTWSPDGRHLIFSSNRSGRYQLYTIDYDGSNLKQLTSKGENKMPKWQKK
ncbi:MAG: Tol-Pal system beta propeller repeat protein TolB [Candidatus Aminicenantes bacterium]|nr:Tol-Pal system beta propeller repeat protein TolB [Candidatus Aminicenantes bacterium]